MMISYGKMTTKKSILTTNMSDDDEFDIHDMPCHPWRETRDQRWQLNDHMKEIVKENLSRLDLLKQKATNRKFPGFVAKQKISIQLCLVGLFENYPDTKKYIKLYHLYLFNIYYIYYTIYI